MAEGIEIRFERPAVRVSVVSEVDFSVSSWGMMVLLGTCAASLSLSVVRSITACDLGSKPEDGVCWVLVLG